MSDFEERGQVYLPFKVVPGPQWQQPQMLQVGPEKELWDIHLPGRWASGNVRALRLLSYP